MCCNEDQRFLCDVIEIDGDSRFGFSEPWRSPTKAMNMEDLFDVPLASSGGLRIGEMESAAAANHLTSRFFSGKFVGGSVVAPNFAAPATNASLTQLNAAKVPALMTPFAPTSNVQTLTFGKNTGSICAVGNCALCNKRNT